MAVEGEGEKLQGPVDMIELYCTVKAGGTTEDGKA